MINDLNIGLQAPLRAPDEVARAMSSSSVAVRMLLLVGMCGAYYGPPPRGAVMHTSMLFDQLKEQAASFGKKEPAVTAKAESSSGPSFALPSIDVPDLGGFSLPSFGGAEEEEYEEVDEEVEEEEEYEPPNQIGSLLGDAVSTLGQLVVTSAQLTGVRALRSAKDAAKAAPFYAKAAAQLAVEDAQAKVAEAVAVPEALINDAAGSVKSQLEDAQAKAAGAVEQAKSVRDRL